MSKTDAFSAAKNRVLLTGATGFVGKVVLAELVRRRLELDLERIYLVVRRDRKHTAEERVARLVQSPAFSRLPRGWESILALVEADLTDEAAFASAHALAGELTHVVHCAASVDFDLPVAEAARANIVSSLNVLAFARRCPSLRRMVSVSTAYVTPHEPRRRIEEELVPLPRPARALFEELRVAPDDAAVDARFLAETHHPNTYTLTKCVAEHLLVEERGEVPLTIVRPSIVSACRLEPFPGWIDSRAALAGFVALIGMGHLRAVVVDPDARLDIVPCDDVAARILTAAFQPDEAPLRIRHATAGRAGSNTIETCCRIITDYYARHPLERRSVLRYKGHAGLRFRAYDWWHHRLPLKAAAVGLRLRGNHRARSSVTRLSESIQQLHRAFPYFTRNTFDFRSSLPLPDDFDPEAYIEVVCAGVYRHLLRKDDRRAVLAGRAHKHEQSDLAFALGQPRGNPTVRALGFLIRKGLRRCLDEVTFDQPSFEAAAAEIPPGTCVAVVPTHRSYMDFLLCPLLFFTRPELGVAPPRIAAAEEFSRIPILGRVFEKAGAFYIKRGVGKANLELNHRLRALVAEQQSMMFFIEGKRSRDRRFVPPKTGILRALRGSGQPVALLPVAISYDRVPEERALLGELRSGQKPAMRLRPLLGWLSRLPRGQISLGRVHLSCGRPVLLTSESDVRRVAQSIMSELQTHTVTSTHHLRAFLQAQPVPGVDVEWLKQAITARGGQVLDSQLPVEEELDPLAERCLRFNWIHLFYGEALTRFGSDAERRRAIEAERWATAPIALDEATANDPRVERLLDALFARPLDVTRSHEPAAAPAPLAAPTANTPRSWLRRSQGASSDSRD